MSINAYVGLPGSGKSYSVVENVIVPALKSGRRVWTNIPLNLELIEKLGYQKPVIFETDAIVEDERFFQDVFEAGATIVIDECWRFWPAGLKATNMLMGHKSFFSEHRHMVGSDGNSTEIALITQDLSQLAATVRNLVEFTNRTVKLNAIGASTKFRVDIYQGAVTGPKPPKTQRLRQIFSSYKPEIYRLYQSQTMNQSDEHGDESLTDDRMNIFNSKLLKIGGPVFVLVCGLIIWNAMGSVNDMYQGDTSQESPGQTSDMIMQRVEPVERVQPDQRLIALLKNRDVFITYNNGIYPYIDYVFELAGRDSTSTFGINQLRELGFQLEVISKCLVILKNQDRITTAMCRTNQMEQTADAELAFSQTTAIVTSEG